jgi:hypothetical protein
MIVVAILEGFGVLGERQTEVNHCTAAGKHGPIQLRALDSAATETTWHFM